MCFCLWRGGGCHTTQPPLKKLCFVTRTLLLLCVALQVSSEVGEEEEEVGSEEEEEDEEEEEEEADAAAAEQAAAGIGALGITTWLGESLGGGGVRVCV